MTASLPQRLAETLAIFLLGVGIATVQVLIGGTRLLFSLPGYGLLALAGVLALVSLRRAKPQPDTLCLVSVALFFGYIIGRILLSPVPYVARTDLYIVMGSLVVYGLTATIFTQAKWRMIFLGLLLLLGAVHAFIGAIQFREGNNFMLIPFLRREDYGPRASGFYVCPNHLAGLLEVIGIFGLSMVCWSRVAVWGKLLIGYVTAICYAGAALTASRGGYLSVAASLAVFAALTLLVLRRASGSLPWKVAGVGVIIALIAGAVAFTALRKSDFLSNRAANIADVENIRLNLWQAALEQWKLAPVFGTGSATYRYYGRTFRAQRMQLDPLETHNDYLQLLAEYGVAGALGFLGFLAFHLRAGWKDFQRLGPKRAAIAPRLLSNNLALQLGALSAIAAYVVHSVFDFNLHIPANALLLAFVFGIIANPGVRGGSEPSPPGWGFTLTRLAISALSVLLLIQCVRLLPGEYYAERARTSLRDQKHGETVRYALKGISYERQNPDLFAYLGRARLSLGVAMRNPAAQASFYRAAIEALESARAVAPLEQGFPITLGLLYDLLGRYAEAEEVLQIALQLDPKADYVRQYYRAHVLRWQAAGTAPNSVKPETTSAGGS